MGSDGRLRGGTGASLRGGCFFVLLDLRRDALAEGVLAVLVRSVRLLEGDWVGLALRTTLLRGVLELGWGGLVCSGLLALLAVLHGVLGAIGRLERITVGLLEVGARLGDLVLAVVLTV